MSLVSLLGSDVESIDKDGALLGLSEYFLEVVVGDDLLFEVLHDLGAPFLLILVPAHDGLQQPLATELTDVHAEVHGLVELLKFSGAELCFKWELLLKKSTIAELLLFSLDLPRLMLLMISRN